MSQFGLPTHARRWDLVQQHGALLYGRINEDMQEMLHSRRTSFPGHQKEKRRGENDDNVNAIYETTYAWTKNCSRRRRSFSPFCHLDIVHAAGTEVQHEKGKRKVQGVPKSQTAALPRPQEEEETDKSTQAQTEQTYEKH